MTIKPLADRVVVKLVEAEEKTKGGLILTASAQGVGKVTISGTVVSAEDNSPLLGVAVVVLETMQGVTSNFDGTYTIDAVAGNTISFSFLGCKEAQWSVPATAQGSMTYDVAKNLTANGFAGEKI